MAFGETVSGSIDAVGESDCYTFTGAPGELVLMRMASTSTLKPALSLRRPAGTELCSDLGSVGGTAEAECVLDVGGPHTLLASGGAGFPAGSYGLSRK